MRIPIAIVTKRQMNEYRSFMVLVSDGKNESRLCQYERSVIEQHDHALIDFCRKFSIKGRFRRARINEESFCYSASPLPEDEVDA